ncbi:hypothetical protein HYT55_03600 [Candidatus Woesearchaeota archaeon]|nr:hypothetical protein [Candidatus Woesearchaeota archaeon]
MYLDLRSKREDYFADATATDVMRQHFPDKNPITVEDVRDLALQGRVVVGTAEGDLGSLLGGGEYTLDTLGLVRKIDALPADALLVLPEEYRIPADEARQRVVYDVGTLVNLDAAHVKRALLGEDAKSGRLSQRKKREAQWAPEKVLKAAFDYLHEHKEELGEETCTSYSWFGKDSHRRVVSLYRAIQGAELRAFQDFAAYKLLIPVMEKELRQGKSASSRYKDDLTVEEKKIIEAKLEKYKRYLQRERDGKKLQWLVNSLDVSFNDLIEPVSIPFARHSGRVMRVPSRSRPGKGPYTLQLTGIPLLPRGSEIAYSQTWEVRGVCYCEDKTFRSDRRRKAAHLGNDEDFFCPHEIAAVHSLRRMYQHDPKETIALLPFVLPTKDMMDYVDRLRGQTIMIEHKKEGSKRTAKRTLNHTEMERLLWARVMEHGYDANCTTDIGRFVREKHDPHDDLLKFRV